VEIQDHSFVVLVHDGGEWLASCHGHFIPMGTVPVTHSVEGGWVAAELVWIVLGSEESYHCWESNGNSLVAQPVAQWPYK